MLLRRPSTKQLRQVVEVRVCATPQQMSTYYFREHVRGLEQDARKVRSMAATLKMVGARGFEPPTSCSQSRRATGLRYAPTLELQPLAACPKESAEASVITVLAVYLWSFAAASWRSSG